jgi:alcohol dehydrogenase (cytochrome c)
MLCRTTKVLAKLVLAAVAALLLTAPMALAQTAEELLDPDPADWPTYGRTLDMSRFSPLDEINRDTIGDLGLTWSRSLGFVIDAQFSPAVYDGIMYINGADQVQALDAATGELLWEYVAELHENTHFLTSSRQRGSVVVFEGKVFHTLGDGRVVALDAGSGEELWITPVGNVEVGEGFSSGPIFADGKIIVGPSGADAGGSPGRVLALDSESGEVLWTFHTVPQPGEPGFETWEPPSAAEWGGGSAWVPGAFDPETGTIIYGVGQPIPWWAGEQRQGDNLYTASYVAMDVDTGELKWYHQVIPQDEWDYDLINTPIIADLEIDGQSRRTAILATVTGFIVLIDVESGEFLGSHQMHPENTVHLGYEDDGTPIIDDSLRFTEAGQTKMVCPLRWVDFEPAAFDAQTGTYFRPNTHECYEMTNAPQPDDWQPGDPPNNATLEPLPDTFDRLGGLSAINPVTGEVLWEWTSGYSQRSGVVATAGGLVFMGSPDRTFRAFDAETGDILWRQVLTAYIQANPVTYAVDGKQYVAIPVGGEGPLVIARQSDEPPLVTSDVAIFVFALEE